MEIPGRSCPVAYRYGARALDRAADLGADTLWIAGGLYGNTCALDSLLDAYDREPGSKALVFNGDFHWFDVEPREFARVNEAVLGFPALRGNVETELAAPADQAGCGCAYPEWVGDATVEHSNRIIARLRETAQRHPGLERLARLPMHLVARVGEAKIGIVHGDADSLAGWAFSQETLDRSAERAFAEAAVDIFASSHTCLPVLQEFERGVVVNNGAAGMPNFRGESCGVVTRVSLRPSPQALYRTRVKDVFVEAMPLRYDSPAWHERFLSQWPSGSDAHRSYWDRIRDGPAYTVGQALRTGGR
jgi:predicted phosphodiesterase